MFKDAALANELWCEFNVPIAIPTMTLNELINAMNRNGATGNPIFLCYSRKNMPVEWKYFHRNRIINTSASKLTVSILVEGSGNHKGSRY